MRLRTIKVKTLIQQHKPFFQTFHIIAMFQNPAEASGDFPEGLRSGLEKNGMALSCLAEGQVGFSSLLGSSFDHSQFPNR